MRNSRAMKARRQPEGGFVEVGGVGGELDAHKEQAGLDVLMLVGVEDVDVVAVCRRGS
jgi:hypothetical protein